MLRKLKRQNDRIMASVTSTIKPLQNLLANAKALGDALSSAKQWVLADDIQFIGKWQEYLRYMICDF